MCFYKDLKKLILADIVCAMAVVSNDTIEDFIISVKIKWRLFNERSHKQIKLSTAERSESLKLYYSSYILGGKKKDAISRLLKEFSKKIELKVTRHIM